MKFKYFNTAFLAILLSVSIVGCKKTLDQTPQQSVPISKAIEIPDDVESAMIGAYSIMGGGALYGTNLNLVPELLASDNYCSWRGTFQGQRQISLKNMTRDNAEASRIWIAAYRAINAANTVIENLDIITDADQKSKLEGEALWVRAIMHFELVRLYGLPYDASVANNTQLGVPIMIKATKTEADAFTYPARNTVEEVYNAVIADLTNAVTKLPASNGFRASKAVANAFLAKVFLQKGDFANARDAANAAITADYQMNIDVLGSFTNKNTKESYFEIQQNEQNNAGTSNDGLATFYASFPGIGRADVRMNVGFVGTYPLGDTRIEKWYYIGTGARPGNTYCAKWQSFSQNIPVLRLAEVLLIRAECNLRLNTAVGATPQADMAQIRNPVRTNLPVIVAPTLNDILAERQFELAFEGFRIHEIRRLKSATGVFQWNADELVLPIPQREIDANASLVQNPGY
jgi:hypothetical protein